MTACTGMQDISQPQLHHWFVKKAVTMAMDRHDKEREMICSLLSSLYSVVRTHDSFDLTSHRFECCHHFFDMPRLHLPACDFHPYASECATLSFICARISLNL